MSEVRSYDRYHRINPTRLSTFDEFFYDLNPVDHYESEGTFGQGTPASSLNYESGAVAGNRCRINHDPTGETILASKVAEVITRIITNETLNQRVFVGLFDALPTAASPPVEPANGIYFRRIDTGTVGNWFAVSRSASTETATDTTIAGDTNPHNLEVQRDATPDAHFILDGGTPIDITTNVPTVALFWGVIVVTEEAVAHSFDIDCLSLEAVR